MPYSQFTLSKAKKAFELTLVEGLRFFPEIESISPSPRLASELEDLPWTIAVGSEKARSEAIVYPVLQEVRRILNRQISLFSGREFNKNHPTNGMSDDEAEAQVQHSPRQTPQTLRILPSIPPG